MVNTVGHSNNKESTQVIGNYTLGADYIMLDVQETNDGICFKPCLVSTNKMSILYSFSCSSYLNAQAFTFDFRAGAASGLQISVI